METDATWPLNFAKVSDHRYHAIDEFGHDFGLYVDIFPIDGIPEDDRDFTRQVKRIRAIEKIWSNQVFSPLQTISKNYSIIKNLKIIIGKLLHRFIPMNKIVSTLVCETSKYDFYSSRRCCNYTENELILNCSDYSYGETAIFEGQRYSVPKNWDKYLRVNYGNYMELPPIENRVLQHGIQAYKK